MIIKKSEYPRETIIAMKCGKGEFQIEHLTERTLLGAAGRLFARGTLKPGHSVGWHQHEDDMEICYFLQGTATVYDNNRMPCQINPGDTHVCKQGQSHSIENNGNDDLVYLAAVIYPE